MSDCKKEKDKITVVFDTDVLELLREYAYLENIRSRNWAVTEIVSDFIREWDASR